MTGGIKVLRHNYEFMRRNSMLSPLSVDIKGVFSLEVFVAEVAVVSRGLEVLGLDVVAEVGAVGGGEGAGAALPPPLDLEHHAVQRS